MAIETRLHDARTSRPTAAQGPKDGRQRGILAGDLDAGHLTTDRRESGSRYARQRTANWSRRTISQRPAGRQITLLASRSCIVGGEEPRHAVPFVELTDVGCAGQDVVLGVVGVDAKMLARAQLAHVPGMICIRPMAPFFDRVRVSPPVSTRMLAAVKGDALTCRPDGRPGPPLRAMAIQCLAGTEEWRAF
jgi:hypothetical protein